MTKKQLIADPTSCLNKAADDEPVFLLRAQDILAPLIVREWASALVERNQHQYSEKATEALLVSQAMIEWQMTTMKVKVPD